MDPKKPADCWKPTTSAWAPGTVHKIPPGTGFSLGNWYTYAGNKKQPTPRKIPRSEVMLHDKPTDMWMVLYGNVYDCTEWAKYHPGGVDVMLQCAGRDGTALYEYYHKWVNLEALFSKFLLGPVDMNADEVQTVTMEEVAKHNTETDCWIAVDGKAYNCTSWLDVHPGGSMSIMNYAGQEASAAFHGVHSPYAEEKLKDFLVGRITGLGVMDSLRRVPPPPELPAPTPPPSYHLPILSIKEISHNTKLFRISTLGMRFDIPDCGHLSVEAPSGARRSYTPIHTTSDEVDIIIKCYPGGEVSPYMHSLQVGDKVKLLGPFAPRDLKFPLRTKIMLVAGGTGIAPFVVLMQKVASKLIEQPASVHLVNCNRTKKDLLLQQFLTDITAQSDSNVQVTNVFSQEEPYKTRLTEHLLLQLGASFYDQVVICGPSGFNKSTAKIFEKLGYLPAAITMLE